MAIYEDSVRTYYSNEAYDVYEDDKIESDLLCAVNNFSREVIAISKKEFNDPEFNLFKVLDTLISEPQNTHIEEASSEYLENCFKGFHVIRIGEF